MIDDGGGGGCHGSGFLMWVHGGGLVVPGLRLVCGWIFAGFVVGLVSWWSLCGGD